MLNWNNILIPIKMQASCCKNLMCDHFTAVGVHYIQMLLLGKVEFKNQRQLSVCTP